MMRQCRHKDASAGRKERETEEVLLIEVKNLTKKYGANLALRGVSFTIRPGKIYGLLGPNGAGKSTTMNIITGCLAPTEGTVAVNGKDVLDDPIAVKRQIGYLPEIPPLFPDMTPQEYLLFVAQAKGVPYEKAVRQVREVMESTALIPVKDKLCRSLSKGYCQRVGIAQAMLGNPDVLILDEPTVGLDPRQIVEIRQLIRSFGKNKTVIVSSHILSEIREICDRVIIISNGQIVADDEISVLEQKFSGTGEIRMAVKGDRETVSRVLSGIADVKDFRFTGQDAAGNLTLTLTPVKDKDPREDIFFAAAAARCVVISSEQAETPLESIFLSLTDNKENKQATDTTEAEAEADAGSDQADDAASGDTHKEGGDR